VANGAPLDTSGIGNFVFAVTGTDGAGNTTTSSANYSVGAPALTFTALPSALAFGSQTIKVASAARVVTVTNTGTAALPLASVSFAGANPHQFSETSTCGTSLGVGATCTVNVVFRPTTPGNKRALLNVNAGGGAGTQAVTLSGIGVAAPYTVSSTSLAFGAEPLRVASGPLVVTVTNTGAAALPITSITLNGGARQFSQTNTCGTLSGGGGVCTISVTFKPTATGPTTATLRVNAGNGAGTQTVTLTGTGAVPSYTVVPGALVFGSQPHGTSSVAQPVTVTNTGAVELPIQSITLAGTNPGQFLETNDCGTSVAAGTSCTIDVVFKPAVRRALAAVLNVNAGGEAGTQVVALSGTGT
jgi:hypothetical protein